MSMSVSTTLTVGDMQAFAAFAFWWGKSAMLSLLRIVVVLRANMVSMACLRNGRCAGPPALPGSRGLARPAAAFAAEATLVAAAGPDDEPRAALRGEEFQNNRMTEDLMRSKGFGGVGSEH